MLNFVAIFPEPFSTQLRILAGLFSFVKGFMLVVLPLCRCGGVVGVIGMRGDWARNRADWEVDCPDFG
jgi:hypothetical protein